MQFEDRRDAGRRLAARLRTRYDGDVVVVGLHGGGVAVAYEIACDIGAPLEVVVVRTLRVPHQPVHAFGALSEDGTTVIDNREVTRARLTRHEMAQVQRDARHEIDRSSVFLRQIQPRVPLGGRTVVVVADGSATAAAMRAACRDARARGARWVVVALPVAPRSVVAEVSGDADDTICLAPTSSYAAAARSYRRFDQVSDADVAELLRRAAGRSSNPAHFAQTPPPWDEMVRIPAGDAMLNGHLAVPEHPIGIVLFAHGSGSSRHSARNRFVAEVLNRAGVGTLLLDLLTPDEEGDRARVFDIALLSRRLVAATSWLAGLGPISELPIGYFGASTGAAAALRAAADLRTQVAAVVSRGGRPDLTGSRLAEVVAPTLLIVGGADSAVLALNREALQAMSCDVELTVVPGATHLFAEPGALERVAELARDWFVERLSMTMPARPDDSNGEHRTRF
ncbi:hypothetical protein GCM10011610_56130 [Nocardia rhizosphaerihabitans]|uniref:Dienelactone hydrolase domain-containing protein n=1 Tax=Nocardia rhizosphaerihabitans TaxID=1691570 RepID=A0ABQ2KUL2_9NOCA|nr:hypothetical protein GCM10011610_56130 [Nocardia rhizosphaerihabitans]